jgi:hypothetical protein
VPRSSQADSGMQAVGFALISDQNRTTRMIRLRSIAWLTLLATLFSAVSPALAALILADKPAALGQMLGLPGGTSSTSSVEDNRGRTEHGAAHSGLAADAHHDGAQSETAGDDGTHQSHGIYCSLCLNPSSLATVAPLPPSLWLLGLEPHLEQAHPQPTRSASFLPLYHSRAPPVTS